MNDKLNIPLLDDLVTKGQSDSEHDQSPLSFDENSDLQIEQDSPNTIEATPANKDSDKDPEALDDDASVQELLIDEEIRMILES